MAMEDVGRRRGDRRPLRDKPELADPCRQPVALGDERGQRRMETGILKLA
jgi:hypothetical protein